MSPTYSAGDVCERKAAEKLWKKPDVRYAILIAANSPELVRVCDAWRVYDFALNKQIVSEVKLLLRILNPTAFSAMCEYEAEEIDGAARAAIAKATGGNAS